MSSPKTQKSNLLSPETKSLSKLSIFTAEKVEEILKDALEEVHPSSRYIALALDEGGWRKEALYWRAHIIEGVRKLEELRDQLEQQEPKPIRDIATLTYFITRLAFNVFREVVKAGATLRGNKQEIVVYQIAEEEEGEEEDDG